MAKLKFTYGTMESGKTINLLKDIYSYENKGFHVLLLKSKEDTKGGEWVVARNGMKRKVDIMLDQGSLTDVVLDNIKPNTKCIYVDEAQLLTDEQIFELFVLTKKLNIPVECFGLRNNFQMQVFKGAKTLLAIAETLEEITTICNCGEKARYVGRTVDGEYVDEGEEVIISGSKKNVDYVPMCGRCYLKKVKKKEL